ncbi:MAG: glycosyltransferase family 4 protein [Rhodomicrobium sp.]|nr:glycosyltransferase family 4 protein [Rhodomicrobium sp.]
MSADSARQPAPRGDWSRLLFVLPAMGAGGSERVVATIANEWARQGRHIGIVTFEPSSATPYYPLDPKVSFTQLDLPPISRPKWRAAARTLERISALRRTFREFAPDAVISFLTKTNVMSVAAAQGLNIPVIISERNNPELQEFDPLWNWSRARAYPRAYSFVTMTQRAADFYPVAQRPRTRIIANPVVLPEWKEERGGHVLTAVGRLNRQKRFDRLIDAFSLIAADHPTWKLVIWGKGPDLAALQAQRDRLGLTDRVEFPGLTSAPGLWVETADIFVLSSEYEGWANVIVEAMAAGLPVVSFDCPFGPREIISHGVNGILAPSGDVRALAAALSEVMGDENLRRRLGQGAEESSRKYTPAAITGEWAKIVSEAVAARRTPRASV